MKIRQDDQSRVLSAALAPQTLFDGPARLARAGGFDLRYGGVEPLLGSAGAHSIVCDRLPAPGHTMAVPVRGGVRPLETGRPLEITS